MGIDSLRFRSESIPMGTYSRKYKFAATTVSFEKVKLATVRRYSCILTEIDFVTFARVLLWLPLFKNKLS